MTSNSHKTILIRRNFDAPVARVWEALTDEEVLKHWWGPKNYTCPYYDLDLEKGGKYLAAMRSRGNGSETWSTGVFVEIIPEKKLMMTDNFADNQGNIIHAPKEMPGDWSHNLIITYALEENRGKTAFTLTHEGLPAEVYDDCVKGWNESLDKLEANLR